MEAATDTTQDTPMTKVQKLAALLIILGQESASQLLRHLDEDELEAVSLEMARLTFVSQELQREILEEFTDVAVAASAAVLNSLDRDLSRSVLGDLEKRKIGRAHV